MAEYIEKEKLFDCLDIKNALGGHYGISLTAINAIPAADVMKVVRCRDCRYFYNGFMKCCTNHLGVVLTDENGFCHHAKRREDEGGNTRWVESNTYITPQQKKM